MFCPKCGANLDDNARFCTTCGCAIEAPAETPVEAPAEVAANPVFNTPAAPVAPAEKVGKWNFDLKVAPMKNRIFTFIVWALTIAVIAVMMGGYSAVVGNSVEEIPVVSIAFEALDADEDFDQLKDTLEEEVEEAEYQLDLMEDEMSKKEVRLAKDLLGALEDCTDTLSVNNVIKVVDVVKEADDEIDDLGLEMDEVESIAIALNIVKYIALFGALFALAFTFFGGLFRIRGLVITGLVFSILYTLPFCGAPYLIFAVLIHAAMITFISINKKAYNKYLFNT
jgi:hypothetical protein